MFFEYVHIFVKITFLFAPQSLVCSKKCNNRLPLEQVLGVTQIGLH